MFVSCLSCACLVCCLVFVLYVSCVCLVLLVILLCVSCACLVFVWWSYCDCRVLVSGMACACHVVVVSLSSACLVRFFVVVVVLYCVCHTTISWLSFVFVLWLSGACLLVVLCLLCV